MTYSVEVTEEHISKSGCPLERAINEQTPLGVHVGCKSLTVWMKESQCPIQVAITYNRALDFISKRDSGKNVKPFNFQFEVT